MYPDRLTIYRDYYYTRRSHSARIINNKSYVRARRSLCLQCHCNTRAPTLSIHFLLHDTDRAIFQVGAKPLHIHFRHFPDLFCSVIFYRASVDVRGVCLCLDVTRCIVSHSARIINNNRDDHDFFTACSAEVSSISIFKDFPKFKRVTPTEGAKWERVRKIGDVQPISRRISETVRDRVNVTINH